MDQRRVRVSVPRSAFGRLGTSTSVPDPHCIYLRLTRYQSALVSRNGGDENLGCGDDIANLGYRSRPVLTTSVGTHEKTQADYRERNR
jgi:hypothetical protein